MNKVFCKEQITNDYKDGMKLIHIQKKYDITYYRVKSKK